jgi:putative methyltransferase (TIGR04325 family)
MVNIDLFYQKLKDKINYFLKRKIEISGDYNSFNEAAKNCIGYDNELIIEKKIASFLEILKGNAAYEQDTKLYFKEKYDYDLIKYLESIQKTKKKNISVLDFGGSFGSIYFKNYKKFKNLYVWDIIEQKKIVDYFKKNEFKIDINFFEDLIEYNKSPDIAIFSGSVQYLPNPFEVLQQLIDRNVRNFLFLKTSFHYKKENNFRIQKIPKNIYDATYPITIFSYQKFTDFFKSSNFEIKKFRKTTYIDGIDHLNLNFFKD